MSTTPLSRAAGKGDSLDPKGLGLRALALWIWQVGLSPGCHSLSPNLSWDPPHKIPLAVHQGLFVIKANLFC